LPSSQNGNWKFYSFYTLRGVILRDLGISVCNFPSLHTSFILLSSVIYILSLEIFYTTFLYKPLPLTSPRRVSLQHLPIMENQCLTTLLHIGAWAEKADPFYDMTSHNIYVMSILNDISSITSFSEAYPSYSHITHQPTFVTKSWARRDHSHPSTLSLALEFKEMLNYSHTPHPSIYITSSPIHKQRKYYLSSTSTQKGKLMLERWLFEEIGDSPWAITTSVPEIAIHSALFSESAAYGSAALDFGSTVRG
jgi:hypothetical protein